MKKVIIIGAGIIESTMMAHAIATKANVQGIEIIAANERPFENYEPLRIVPLPLLEPQKIYISTYNDKKKHLHTKFHATAKTTNGIRGQGAKNKNRPRNPVFHTRKLPRPKK